MEIKPHPLLPDRLGIFRLRVDDVVEGMSVLSAIEIARGIMLKDRWLSAHLSPNSKHYPVTVSVWRTQLGRIATGLDGLARNTIFGNDSAAETGLVYTALADKIRPHITTMGSVE